MKFKVHYLKEVIADMSVRCAYAWEAYPQAPDVLLEYIDYFNMALDVLDEDTYDNVRMDIIDKITTVLFYYLTGNKDLLSY